MNAGELSEKLTFGKYKGKTVADVLIEDPSYLVWAHNNVDFFKVSTELLQIARSTIKPDPSRRRYLDDDPDWDIYEN